MGLLDFIIEALWQTIANMSPDQKYGCKTKKKPKDKSGLSQKIEKADKSAGKKCEVFGKSKEEPLD